MAYNGKKVYLQMIIKTSYKLPYINHFTSHYTSRDFVCDIILLGFIVIVHIIVNHAKSTAILYVLGWCRNFNCYYMLNTPTLVICG